MAKGCPTPAMARRESALRNHSRSIAIPCPATFPGDFLSRLGALRAAVLSWKNKLCPRRNPYGLPGRPGRVLVKSGARVRALHRAGRSYRNYDDPFREPRGRDLSFFERGDFQVAAKASS